MCQPASFVVTKTNVFWSKVTDSHEDIIREFNLGHLDRWPDLGLVRIEISPPDLDFSLPTERWQFRTDQDRVPEWYNEDVVESQVRGVLTAWIDQKVVYEGLREASAGVVYASGSATVKAYDSATVEASGNATVEANDNATVYANDNATVYAYGNATVYAYGNATVEANDNATIIIPKRYSDNVILSEVSGEAVVIDRRDGIKAISATEVVVKFEEGNHVQ